MSRLRNLRRRVNRARRFPVNTCPASRHLHLMADALATGKRYYMFEEVPVHCAESIYAVLLSLWQARTQLKRLGKYPSPRDKKRLQALIGTERPERDA